MDAINFRAGAPPGRIAKRTTGQGGAFGVLREIGLGAREKDSTVRWRQYEDRRRERRKRSGSAWPAEVVK